MRGRDSSNRESGGDYARSELFPGDQRVLFVLDRIYINGLNLDKKDSSSFIKKFKNKKIEICREFYSKNIFLEISGLSDQRLFSF